MFNKSWNNISNKEKDEVIFTLDNAIRNIRLKNSDINDKRINAMLAARRHLLSSDVSKLRSWILPIAIGFFIGICTTLIINQNYTDNQYQRKSL